MDRLRTAFTEHVGIEVPLICGAMYPCSNPELVAAVSAAGGIGIVQPMSMSFVHGHDLRDGIRLIRRLTDRPIGFNAIVEKSSRIYEERMRRWVDVALEEGVRFFITALGNPRWVVSKVHAAGGVVYHDVTSRAWAEKALAEGVDGLICVNSRAGGHAGVSSPERMIEELGDLGVPLICAGGIGDERAFVRALSLGYAGAQLGTRFIATTECRAHDDYKQAILRAREDDIVLTEKISGVPVAVIRTPYVERVGTKAGWLAKRMLRHPRAKHWMRALYSLKGIWELRRASLAGSAYRDYFQA
ncbi:MAG TPA: nitronate monooxygenase, partial [Sandaracinaceae bacterium]